MNDHTRDACIFSYSIANGRSARQHCRFAHELHYVRQRQIRQKGVVCTEIRYNLLQIESLRCAI